MEKEMTKQTTKAQSTCQQFIANGGNEIKQIPKSFTTWREEVW
jgi:hypothetical protein